MLDNIIVTGGAGFIGSNLVLELQRQYPDAKITIIDDFRNSSFKTLEDFEGDVIAGELSALPLGKYFDASKINSVFHLASITDTTEHDQYLQVHDNVESWRNLLNFFAGQNTRFVFASSAATYGQSAIANKIDQAQKPANVYAFSKVLLENLARDFAKENPEQWTVGLRYFNVYGPRETHKLAASSMIYQLAQQMKQGKRPRIFKDGEQKRDFVYVKDIVDYTIAAATSPQARSEGTVGIYNAGSGVPRSFNDIISILNQVLNTELETEYIENPYSFYQPHTEADLLMTRECLRKEPQFSLEEGIKDYLASGWL
ncbi:MAG: ADP-glyceromanno-heptose 6-epimerase [Abditibacteriaceae bacterium]